MTDAAADAEADATPTPGAPAPRPPTSLRAALGADVRRAVTLSIGGCLLWAVVELLATIWAYPGNLHLGTAFRLIALDLTLVAVAWIGVAAVMVGAAVVARLRRSITASDGRTWPGLYAALPSAATAWAIMVGAVLYTAASTRLTYGFVKVFKEPFVMALLLAVLQLVLFAIAWAIGRWVRWLVQTVGVHSQRLPRARVVDPLSSPAPALVVTVALTALILLVAGSKAPQLRPLIPWRHLLGLVAIGTGAALTGWRLARGPLLAPKRRRQVRLAAIAGLAVLIPLTLVKLGADAETRYVVITSSPTLGRVVDAIRKANDFDRDGFGSLLGEKDCAPFDKKIHPGVRDVPDDGIDQNCDGRDFSLRNLATVPLGERLPVPEPFRRDWNILLVTIDTVRYDHTSFGGYRDGPRKRDTTPRLAELVKKSTSFSFANAPSAGTMASIPAILTSKFFHSGIALDEKVKHGMPPRLKPENTLISEILKRAGYATGAIVTHEYFNDWGMEQGFDTYDNEIGKTGDPFRISSHLVTDRAIAWISRHANKKWFLWTHYIDPHGRYVDHPDDVSYGTTEEDLYDSELHYTDKHFGRLLDELARLPGGDRTIVIVTSDHGDAFGEHGFINHGQALYRELLHVPLIVYVPDAEPRELAGVVTPLDIVPTVADLAGIDVSDLSFEGQSLVPDVFYGRQDPARVVFAETNWPKPLRAAVSTTHKLVYNLQNNLYELFDLRVDPWEKTNIATRDATARAALQDQLEAWLERVFYSRDAAFNQAANKISSVLLTAAPTPGTRLDGVTFDDGKLEVLGWEPEAPGPYKPGDKLYVKVYFKAVAPPSGTFKLQVQAWPVPAGALNPKAAQPPRVARSPLRITLEGFFPTDRWRAGEYIREHFGLVIPNDWRTETGDKLAIGMWMTDAVASQKLTPTGPVTANDPSVAVLGTVPFTPGAAEPPTPTPPPTPGVPTLTPTPGKLVPPPGKVGPGAPAPPPGPPGAAKPGATAPVRAVGGPSAVSKPAPPVR